MKVKNLAFFGVMASILGISGAYADTTTVIASQAYVDNTTVAKSQGSENANKVMITNSSGTVVPGTLSASDVSGVEVTTNKETGTTLTDSTTKYPSSHTVKAAIDAIDVSSQITGKVDIQQENQKNKIVMTNGDSQIDTFVEVGDNLAVKNGKLVGTVTDTDTTYTAGTGLNLSGTEFALSSGTQTSLGKADSSIQGVKRNNTALIPDSNGVVNVTVPTATSELTNDSGFLTSHQDISGKVDIQQENQKNKIVMTNGDSQIDTFVEVGDNLAVKNGKLVGTVTDTDTTYTAGTNVQISDNNVISATDTTYTAGTGLALSGTEFALSSATQTSLGKADTAVQPGDIGTIASHAEGDYVLEVQGADKTGQVMMTTGDEGKVAPVVLGDNLKVEGGKLIATDTTYTAGTNVDITNGVISATDTTYSAGTGLGLTGTTFSNSGILDVSNTTGNDGEAILTVSKNGQNVTSSKGRLTYAGGMAKDLANINTPSGEDASAACTSEAPCVLSFYDNKYYWTNMNLGNE